MKMKLSDCAQSVQGQFEGVDLEISSISIDTRSIKQGDLYIAIKGTNFDGHAFVEQAEQAGASAVIVHKGVDSTVPRIVVEDTRIALAELAGAWRGRLSSLENNNLSVVGVTGSNGKTTVKEMIAAILAVNAPVLFTQGNLNNDIGVPLTLFRLNEQHRYAVIEMGANHPQEIAYTSQYAQADVVVITNAGAAHLEGFGNLDGVAKAKGEIIETLKDTGCAIINQDDHYVDYWKSLAGNKRILTFGLSSDADVWADSINIAIIDHAFVSVFTLVTQAGAIDINLKLAGRHNILNALAAAASCLALGIDLAQIKQGLESVNPVTGRLQPLVGLLGNVIIDDTYNANASSLKVGLDVLVNIAKVPWLVLGAFGELGSQSLEIHAEMASVIRASGVLRLLAVGAHAKNTVQAFGVGATFFETQQDLIDTLKKELKGDETILVKGSRSQRMENVVGALVENFRN